MAHPRKLKRDASNKPQYKRILLKLSGEALAGSVGYGIDPKSIKIIAREIKEILELGVEVAIVIGGGNIYRGLAAAADGMDRATADYMGMIATMLNALALQNKLEKLGVYTRVQTAIAMQAVAEPYIRRRATRHLEKGRVVIFASGTGNPYFTTDTAASLRAAEIDADILLKATKVEGVYDKDPMKYPNAVLFKELTYKDVINKNIKIMDATAISLCMENRLPIIIFNLFRYGNIKKVVLGEKIGTIVRG